MKIISFNIWGIYGPALEKRWQYASEELAKLDTDILCLQEATDKILLEKLAKKTNLTIQLSDPDETGLCILSKPSAKKVELVPYSFQSPVENYTRKMIIAQYEIDFCRFLITNTHLSWKPDDDATRKRQAISLQSVVESMDLAAILCGDFNCEFDSDALSEFQKSGYVDSLEGTKDEFKPSWDNSNPYIQSHHTQFPDRRVDLTLLKDTSQHNWKLSQSKIILDKKNSDGIYPSDHYGILSEISLT